jgi:DNA-binding response OmpR family regulator
MFDPWQQIRVLDPLGSRPTRSGSKKKEDGKSRRRKPTVLVVDDERLIADTMTEILKRSGFHALCAYDGQSALELAIQITPDFVVTDVVMPKMNGVQLAIAIRKAMPTTEIVLLSGQAGISEIVERGRKQGYAFELIAKPIHPEKLLQRLNQT